MTSLLNAGTINIGAGGTVAFLGSAVNQNRINFAGAGTFSTAGAMTNTGIINAQNNLTGNVVTVGGNYTGGGQFFADYSPSTASADRLNIAGTVTGNTNVTLNRVGGSSFVPGGFLPVVTVTPGAADGAFTSNTAFPTTGFVLESFGRNPAGTTQFGVIQRINPSSTSLGSLSHVAEAASMQLDEPISPYVLALADPAIAPMRFGLWVRGSAGEAKETIASAVSGGGVALSSVERVETDHHSIQFGGDVGILSSGGWDVHLGLLGGWYDGEAHPGGERLEVDSYFAGAYVVVGNGAFTLDGTIRREWRDYTLALPSLFGAGSVRELDGKAIAGSLRASYRIGGPLGFAATPFVGFNYADSDIDDLSIDGLSVYSAGSDTTKVGQAGARVSYRFESGSDALIEPFASAAALKNWSHRDTGSFSFGAAATTFALETATWDDAMRYSIGVMAHARNGRVSAFITGNLDDGSGLDGAAVNGGVRFNF